MALDELLKLYKTLIRPEVSYGAEAWTLTKKEEQALLTAVPPRSPNYAINIKLLHGAESFL